jgi:hypothetical protein
VSPDLPALARRGFDRCISLQKAEAAAVALPETRRARVTSLAAAGRARCDAALGQSRVAALVLSRAAIPLYLEAAITAHGDEPPPDDVSVGELWSLYDDLAAGGSLPTLPSGLVPVREQSVARKSMDSEIAALGEEPIEATLALASFLADTIEVRSPGRVRAERRIRYVGLVLSGVFMLAEVIAHRPKGANVALNSVVVASSRRPGSGPPQDLINGKLEEGIAFSTRDEADPWLMLDLVSPRRIHEVTLVNGTEYADDSLPLRVETSVDGTTWQEGAVRMTTFTRAEPAIVSFGKRSARFVRIHGKPGGAVYLSEVEVR